jgi:hypothetical protein
MERKEVAAVNLRKLDMQEALDIANSENEMFDLSLSDIFPAGWHRTH